MAITIVDALAEVQALLSSAKIKAVSDPRNLNLPGILVYPANLSYDRLDRSAAYGEFDVYLITRDNGATQAMADLDAMASDLETRGVLPAELDFISLTLPNHGADNFPALQFKLELELTNIKES